MDLILQNGSTRNFGRNRGEVGGKVAFRLQKPNISHIWNMARLLLLWVTVKHDGIAGTRNCFEDVRIAIDQNGRDGTANCCR